MFDASNQQGDVQNNIVSALILVWHFVELVRYTDTALFRILQIQSTSELVNNCDLIKSPWETEFLLRFSSTSDFVNFSVTLQGLN